MVQRYTLNTDQMKMSINWRELYAIVVSMATWGHVIRNKKLLLHCGNMLIFSILQSGTCTSKNERLMDLVRMLFYITAHYNILCSAVHIPTQSNCIADSLSRLQFDLFHELAPVTNEYMTIPYPVHELYCHNNFYIIP